MPSLIDRLQIWYHAQCDGDWEQTEGVDIETLDNPGWKVEIDLRWTALSDVPFDAYSYGVRDEAATSGDDWVECRRDESKWLGYGGPQKLTEILSTFLAWAESDAP